MSYPAIEIEIEGRFIDSYIYSGTLFLVDYDGILSTFRWEELLIHLEESHVLNSTLDAGIGLLRDSRELRGSPLPVDGGGTQFPKLAISEKTLRRFAGNSTPIEVWPTDFSIYSNRIYFSSEEGVDQYKFEWDKGEILTISARGRVWGKSAFRVCPNFMNRVAIASGNDGLISAAPHGESARDGDVIQILDLPCGDCDWQDKALVASTNYGVKIAASQIIPSQTSWKGSNKEYWTVVNSIRQKPPRDFHNLLIGDKPVESAWIAGDKLFALDDMARLYVAENVSESSSSLANDYQFKFELLESKREEINSRVLLSRTGPFGTLIETEDSLSLLSEDGFQSLSQNAGRWRIFPRAKNYSNQLHIVENERLRVLGFDFRRLSKTERFGFSPDVLTQ